MSVIFIERWFVLCKGPDIYYKFIVELNSSYIETSAGIQSRYNKFIKLMFLTDDSRLCILTNIYIKCLKEHKVYDANFMKSQAHYSTRSHLQHAFKELDSYLTICINSNKKEWQIIAEQNGWTPPTH